MKRENLIETKIQDTVIVEYKVELNETGDSYVSSIGRVYEAAGKFSYKVHGRRDEIKGYATYEDALDTLLNVAWLK